MSKSKKTETIDYWGKESITPIPESPKVILLPIASSLGFKTDDLVIAEVKTYAIYENHFEHEFNLHIPSLDNYHYELFSVRHDIDLYPAKVFSGETETVVNNEEEFKKWLLEKLKEDNTIKVIKSLASQASPKYLDDEIPF